MPPQASPCFVDVEFSGLLGADKKAPRTSATSPSELDDFAWVKFHLDRSTGANPSVTVTDHSPCSGVVCGYGGNP